MKSPYVGQVLSVHSGAIPKKELYFLKNNPDTFPKGKVSGLSNSQGEPKNAGANYYKGQALEEALPYKIVNRIAPCGSWLILV